MKEKGEKNKKFSPPKTGNTRQIKHPFFPSHNFSEVEDHKKAFEFIRSIATHAGINAVAEAKAAGLPRVYIRNHKELVRISPDGKVRLIRTKKSRPFYYIKYKPNTVLHALSS